jgi:hypothetical protein
VGPKVDRSDTDSLFAISPVYDIGAVEFRDVLLVIGMPAGFIFVRRGFGWRFSCRFDQVKV